MPPKKSLKNLDSKEAGVSFQPPPVAKKSARSLVINEPAERNDEGPIIRPIVPGEGTAVSIGSIRKSMRSSLGRKKRMSIRKSLKTGNIEGGVDEAPPRVGGSLKQADNEPGPGAKPEPKPAGKKSIKSVDEEGTTRDGETGSIGSKKSKSSFGKNKKRVSRKSVKTGNKGGVEDPGGVGGRRKSSAGSRKKSLSRSLKSGNESIKTVVDKGGVEEPVPPDVVGGGGNKPESTTTIAPSRKKSGKRNTPTGSGREISGKSNRKPPLDDLEVTHHLFKYGVDHDLENQRVWSCRSALLHKKTLIILAVLFLLLSIVIIAVVAGGQGGGINNKTTTTITSASPTMSTTPPAGVPGCTIPFPGISNSTALGQYCKFCFFVAYKKCIDECCGRYYANGSNDWTNCQREC